MNNVGLVMIVSKFIVSPNELENRESKPANIISFILILWGTAYVITTICSPSNVNSNLTPYIHGSENVFEKIVSQVYCVPYCTVCLWIFPLVEDIAKSDHTTSTKISVMFGEDAANWCNTVNKSKGCNIGNAMVHSFFFYIKTNTK